MTMSSQKSPDQYLREPYARVLTPDPETNTYTAQIMEFPGCVAQGDSPEEAYANLEQAAKGWIQAALDTGQSIPEPAVNQVFGGKILLRVPRSLHRQVAELANREGTSLNQFIVAALAEKIGAVTASNQALQLIRTYYQGSAIIMSGVRIMQTYPTHPRRVQSGYAFIMTDPDNGSKFASTAVN